MNTRSAVVGIVLALAGQAVGATIEVFPGPGTPFQDAIGAATPGDRLRVHAGVYAEAVVIDKALTINAAGDGAIAIDAGCAAPTALEVASDKVRVEGEFSDDDLPIRPSIYALGGTVQQILIQGRRRISLTEVGTCTGSHCDELGIPGLSACAVGDGLVIDASSRVKVRLPEAGFVSGANVGLRLRNLARGAGVKVIGEPHNSFIRVSSAAADAAIVVEDSGGSASLGRSGIRIQGVFAFGANVLEAGGVGLAMRLENASGVRVKQSELLGRPSAVTLGVGSNNNFFTRSIFGNSVSGVPSDGPVVSDLGAGNCALHAGVLQGSGPGWFMSLC